MLAALVAAAAARFAERDFLVDDGVRCSFAALHERAWSAARALSARGIVAGDRVALMAPNSIDFVAGWLGVTLAGATVVPIPTVSAPPEIAHRMSHARCKLLLDQVTLADLMRTASSATATAAAPPIPAADALAMILYTSGTTGTAKAASFTHASLTTHTANVARTIGLGDGDVILGALPLTHSFGLRMVMLLGLHTGARVVLLRRFDPAQALALADAEGVTFWPAVPTMLAAACASDGPRPRALGWVLSAGAPLPDALCRRAEERLGCVVRQGYGLTEASFSTIDAPPSPRALGTVGRPVEGVTVRLDDGGEIQVRGPHVTAGYADDDAATAAAFADGWLRTGDVGRLDGDGRLTIVDRTKDLIIRGGNNVYPSEVEAALAAHPAVADVAVIGRPDDYYGEEVVAVIVPRAVAAATVDLAAELADFARARVAATKVPREWAFVDALPLGPSGKVLKRALRQRLLDGGLPTTKPPR